MDRALTAQCLEYKHRRRTRIRATDNEEAALFENLTFAYAEVAARYVAQERHEASYATALAASGDVAYEECVEYVNRSMARALCSDASSFTADALASIVQEFNACLNALRSAGYLSEWLAIEVGIHWCAYSTEAVKQFLDDERVRARVHATSTTPPETVLAYARVSLTAATTAFTYAAQSSRTNEGVALDAFKSHDPETRVFGERALQRAIADAEPEAAATYVQAFATRVNERQRMCVCATCGIADPFTKFFDMAFEDVKNVLRFSPTTTAFYERANVEVAIGPNRVIRICDLIEHVERDGERFHVYGEFMREDGERVERMDVCEFCAQELYLKKIPSGSLADGVWGLASVVRGVLPKLNFVEAMALSKARPVAVVRRVSRRSGTHDKLVSNLITFDQSNFALYEAMVCRSRPRPVDANVVVPPRNALLETITIQFVTPRGMTPSVFGQYLSKMDVNPANLYAYIAVSKYIEACYAPASTDITDELVRIQEMLEREYGEARGSFHVELLEHAQHVVDEEAAVSFDAEVDGADANDIISEMHALSVEDDLCIIQGAEVKTKLQAFHACVPVEALKEPLSPLGTEEDTVQYYRRMFSYLFLFADSAKAAAKIREREMMLRTLFHFARFATKQYLFVAHAHWRALEIFRQTRVRFDKNEAHCIALMNYYNRADYKQVVHAIRTNTADARAAELARCLEKHGYFVSSAVSFTEERRRVTKSVLSAYCAFYGPPNFFITIAVDDIHSLSCLRLALPARNSTGFPCNSEAFLDAFDRTKTSDAEFARYVVEELQLPSEQMLAIANESPAAVARLFQVVVDAVTEHVVRSASTADSHYSSRMGALGPLISAPYVLQSNERGSLHMHMLAFGSPLSAKLLSEVAHDVALHSRIVAVVNEIVATMIPFDVAVSKQLLRKAHEPICASRDVAMRPACDVTAENADELFNDIFESRNRHRHTFTCHRDARGRTMCRMGYARTHNTQTGVVELRRETDPSSVECIVESSCACKEEFTVSSARVFDANSTEFTCDANGLQYHADERVLCFMHECMTHTLIYTQQVILCALQALSSQAVFDAWNAMNEEEKNNFEVQMRCLAALFVPTNKALSLSTMSNTNVSLLGTDVQSKLCMFYVIKYMCRPEFYAKKVAETISTILKQYSTGERVSTAVDADTSRRQFLFLMHRAAFSRKTEVTDTCAAAALLGVDSEHHPQKVLTVFLNSNSILEYVFGKEECASRGHVAYETENVAVDDYDDHTSESTSGYSVLIVPEIGSKKHIHLRYTFVEEYMARGPKLHHLSPFEYLGTIMITTLKASMFEFDADFVLSEYFGQTLRPAFVVPRLLRAPRWSASFTSRERDAFARYYLSIFRPTTLPVEECDFTYAAFVVWINALKADKFSTRSRRTLEIFERHAFRECDDTTSKLIDDYRYSCATRWPTYMDTMSVEVDVDEEAAGISGDVIVQLLNELDVEAAVAKRVQDNAQIRELMNQLCNTVCDESALVARQRNAFDANVFSWDAQTVNMVVQHLPEIDEEAYLEQAHYCIEATTFTLNSEQDAFVSMFVNQFTTASNISSKVWMLCGQPGTGKSYVTKALIQRCLNAGVGEALVVSFQGKAATPLSGRTIHSTFGISRGGRTNVSDSSWLLKLPNWQKIQILIIEEFSMVSPALLQVMDEKLRRARNVDAFCGGLVVLALGDPMQIPPVQGHSIYEYMLAGFNEFNKHVLMVSNKSSMQVDVLYVKTHLNLTKINCVWLKQQMRTTDIQRQHAIQVACDPYENKPMRLLLPEVLRFPLSADDMRQQRWQCAPVIVCDNTERHAINVRKLNAVARRRGVPIVRWKKDIGRVHWVRSLVGTEHADHARVDACFDYLYEEEPALWEYFVMDADVMILQNIQPLGKGLTNGTEGRACGLFWNDPVEAHAAAEQMQFADAGEMVTVTKPSAYIVECTRQQLRLNANAPWHTSDTLIPDRIVVPITKTTSDTVHLTGLTAARLGITKVNTHSLSCCSTYAVTTHKMQGETKEQVVLDISNRKKSPEGKYKARYPARTMATTLVACTRVKRSEDMRFVGVDVEYALDDIRNLQHENFARIITVGFMRAKNYQWNFTAACSFANARLQAQ